MVHFPLHKRLSMEDRKQLLAVCDASIQSGLETGKSFQPENSPLTSARLQKPTASFVTLKKNGNLRGCIGSLEARRPLIKDVAENAFSAAFRDPRFTPLTREEYTDIELSISVLTPAEPMQFLSEKDLISQLQPGLDGLVLEDKGNRGTFLPAVWSALPEPADFLQELKKKAGLPADYWSDTLQISRYQTESFTDSEE
ncbi:MAG: AmmeMemoRadiSam system protein A [Gammaproteobacteria bacterium]